MFEPHQINPITSDKALTASQSEPSSSITSCRVTQGGDQVSADYNSKLVLLALLVPGLRTARNRMTSSWYLIMTMNSSHPPPGSANHSQDAGRCDQSDSCISESNKGTQLGKKRMANKVDSQFSFKIVF